MACPTATPTSQPPGGQTRATGGARIGKTTGSARRPKPSLPRSRGGTTDLKKESNMPTNDRLLNETIIINNARRATALGALDQAIALLRSDRRLNAVALGLGETMRSELMHVQR